jgi:hypothetical protein
VLDVQSGGSLTTDLLSVSASNSLNVAGGLVAQQIAVNGGTLHLGNVGLNQTGTVNASQTTFSNGGVLSGDGSLSGSTVIGTASTSGLQRSTLRPGNSPGLVAFDNLILDVFSATVIEVAPIGEGTPGRDAGVDFDQVQVTGALRLLPGSVLEITRFEGGAVARGELVKAFNFAPGKVTGQFGSVTNGLPSTSKVVFNVGTGTIVGLGNETLDAFKGRVATTDNQRSMLSDLEVSREGGVSQLYGGQLIERLVATDIAGGNQRTVFAKTSPEMYSTLLTQAKEALFSEDSIASEIGKPVNAATAEIYGRSRKATADHEYADFAIKSGGLRLGWTAEHADVLLHASLAFDDGKLSSDYLNGSSRGQIASLAASKPLKTGSEWHATGRLSYASFSSKLNRITNDGVASADVDSSGLMGAIGLAHVTQVRGLRVQTSAEVANSSYSVDAFSEKNNDSVSDALRVHKQKQTGNAVIFGLGVSGKLSDQIDFSTSAKLISHDKDVSRVVANLNTEATTFSVKNQGLGRSQLSLDIGLNYRIGKDEGLALKLQTFGSSGSSVNLAYRKAF